MNVEQRQVAANSYGQAANLTFESNGSKAYNCADNGTTKLALPLESLVYFASLHLCCVGQHST